MCAFILKWTTYSWDPWLLSTERHFPLLSHNEGLPLMQNKYYLPPDKSMHNLLQWQWLVFRQSWFSQKYMHSTFALFVCRFINSFLCLMCFIQLFYSGQYPWYCGKQMMPQCHCSRPEKLGYNHYLTMFYSCHTLYTILVKLTCFIWYFNKCLLMKVLKWSQNVFHLTSVFPHM